MTKRPEKTLYRPNLYLLGFMGTGKSSVGRKVAARLKLKFLDSDAEIEKSAGMQINDIFAKYGEEKFRQMERDFMERKATRGRSCALKIRSLGYASC